jgi:hypothetical protein
MAVVCCYFGECRYYEKVGETRVLVVVVVVDLDLEES